MKEKKERKEKKRKKFFRELKSYYLETNMMLHRKDFENHNFSLKIHCKPIYSVRYACSGPEGIIHYSKSTMPPKNTRNSL